jgi:hypothetical protein
VGRWVSTRSVGADVGVGVAADVGDGGFVGAGKDVGVGSGVGVAVGAGAGVAVPDSGVGDCRAMAVLAGRGDGVATPLVSGTRVETRAGSVGAAEAVGGGCTSRVGIANDGGGEVGLAGRSVLVGVGVKVSRPDHTPLAWSAAAPRIPATASVTPASDAALLDPKPSTPGSVSSMPLSPFHISRARRARRLLYHNSTPFAQKRENLPGPACSLLFSCRAAPLMI